MSVHSSPSIVPGSVIDSGITSLAMVARGYGIAVNPEQLRHQFADVGKPCSDPEILLAAKNLAMLSAYMLLLKRQKDF